MTFNIDYYAPKEGYYELMEEVTKLLPTNEWETVRNENRMWFQFWKPRMITRRKYRTEVTHEGRNYRYLKLNEKIEIAPGTEPRRL